MGRGRGFACRGALVTLWRAMLSDVRHPRHQRYTQQGLQPGLARPHVFSLLMLPFVVIPGRDSGMASVRGEQNAQPHG